MNRRARTRRIVSAGFACLSAFCLAWPDAVAVAAAAATATPTATQTVILCSPQGVSYFNFMDGRRLSLSMRVCVCVCVYASLSVCDYVCVCVSRFLSSSSSSAKFVVHSFRSSLLLLLLSWLLLLLLLPQCLEFHLSWWPHWLLRVCCCCCLFCSWLRLLLLLLLLLPVRLLSRQATSTKRHKRLLAQYWAGRTLNHLFSSPKAKAEPEAVAEHDHDPKAEHESATEAEVAASCVEFWPNRPETAREREERERGKESSRKRAHCRREGERDREERGRERVLCSNSAHILPASPIWRCRSCCSCRGANQLRIFALGLSRVTTSNRIFLLTAFSPILLLLCLRLLLSLLIDLVFLYALVKPVNLMSQASSATRESPLGKKCWVAQTDFTTRKGGLKGTVGEWTNL